MRLSAPSANLYHALSVRHFAHMQYLGGKYEEAYQTMKRISETSSDPFALFDTARVAAKTGRKDEALRLIERCIDHDSTFIIRMFGENDFG
jgi:hypothetical protein